MRLSASRYPQDAASLTYVEANKNSDEKKVFEEAGHVKGNLETGGRG